MENNRIGTICYDFICVFIGLVVGVIVGLLFASGLVPNIIVAAWITFGIGILAFVMTLIAQFVGAVGGSGNVPCCMCCYVKSVLAGAVGSVLLAIIALSADLSFTSIGAIVLVGLGAFFLALTLTALVCFSLCIARCCTMRE